MKVKFDDDPESGIPEPIRRLLWLVAIAVVLSIWSIWYGW